jgi:threonine/homoserine efflux transporter RhtA
LLDQTIKFAALVVYRKQYDADDQGVVIALLTGVILFIFIFLGKKFHERMKEDGTSIIPGNL